MITVESLSSIPSAVFASLIIANVFEPTVTFEPAVNKLSVVLAVKFAVKVFAKSVSEVYQPAGAFPSLEAVLVPSAYTYSVSPTFILSPSVGAPTASLAS